MRYLTVALILPLCTACAQPWLVARGTIAGAQGALEAVEGDVPVEGDQAMDITRSALDLGEIAVDMWEESREAPVGFWKWCGAAARGFAILLDILKTAGVPIPRALEVASAAIGALVII
jgi:hypothetical protein